MALIPFDDRDGLIWMNEMMTRMPERTRDHGYIAAVRYLRVSAYGGKIFKSDEHTKRLRQSCQHWILTCLCLMKS